MTLKDVFACMCGDYLIDTQESTKVRKRKDALASIEDCSLFMDYLTINKDYGAVFESVDSHTIFYNICGLFSKVIPDEKKRDVFYSCKLGYMFEGVPSELVYLLAKAVDKYDTPNMAISAIDKRILTKYLTYNALPDGVTMKDVLDNIYGYCTELLSPKNFKAECANGVEFYLKDVDRIFVVPKEIGDKISSREDAESLRFDENLGVCLGDSPVRKLFDEIGLCYNDFDLRTLFKLDQIM